MLRALTIALSVVVTFACLGRRAEACDTCQNSGGTASHDEALGGDDYNDALVPPPEPADEEDPGGSGAFVATGYKWPQPGGLGTLVTITYSFNNMFDGGLKDHNGVSLPASLIRGSIEEALGLWASVAPLKFVEVEDEGRNPVTLGNYANGQFGQIRFSHLYYNGPDPPTGDPVAKALAYYPTSGNLAGDVFFDDGDPWQEVGALHEPDVLGAATHEIGHTLGLAHTTVSTANMYWIFTRYSGLGTGMLQPDDIAGIQSIYGTGKGGVFPLAVDVPEPATWVLMLIGTIALWRWRCREWPQFTRHGGCRSAAAG